MIQSLRQTLLAMSMVIPLWAVSQQSHFDSSLEGWTVAGDATGPYFFTLGGNPDGYIRGDDHPQNIVWYFAAPCKFLGNKSASFGKYIRYDLKTTDAGSANRLLVLKGNGIEIYYDRTQSFNNTWHHVDILLDSILWKYTSNNNQVSRSDFLSVLSNLTELFVRGEFSTRADKGSLDNFILEPLSSVQYTPTFICQNQCFNFFDNSVINPTIWNWYFPGSESEFVNVHNPTNICYRSSGIYQAMFIARNNCTTDTIKIDSILVYPSYTDSSGKIEICEGDTINGHFQTGIYRDTLKTVYLCDSIRITNLLVKTKSFSTINQSICEGQSYLGYTASGTFIDTFVADNGCDSIRTLNLTVKSKSFSNVNQNICEGQSYLGYSTSGTFIDTFGAANGCDSIRTLTLILLDKPNPSLGNDREICKGDSVILFPGQFLSYLWQDGAIKNNIVVYKAGTYSVTVTNSCGSKKDEVLIIEKNCDIYFPNAFTPNSDGRNDVFKILNGFNLKEYHLIIYNRWGQKVFETKDFSKGWNGKLKRMEQEPGAYVWFCKYSKDGIYKEQKGTIVLIR